MGTLLNLAATHATAIGSALSGTETAFFIAVEEGRPVNLAGATFAATWLSWIMTSRDANAAVGMGGIHIQGDPGRPARITGPWSAPHAKATYPIVFERCEFDNAIDLSLGELSLFSFEETRTRAIDLRGCAIGWFRFRNSECCGGIILRLARLERGADFNGAMLVGGHNDALSADWLRTNGPLNFWSLAPGTIPFLALGAIRLYGARIGGELNLREAILDNATKTALNMDQCSVEGSAAFARARITGSLSLVGADIKADLIAEALVLQKGIFNDKRKTSMMLVGDHLRVAGSAYLRNGFYAEGMVRLYGASVGSDLECQNATLVNPAATVLMAEGLRVEGDVHFADAENAARCHIEGIVDLSRAAIKGSLIWQKIDPIGGVDLRLQSAKVTTLNDEQPSWPPALDLHNFEYTTIAEGSPVDAQSRVAWLRRSRDFSHQSYDRLAAVLKQQGRYNDARDILFFKEQRYASETTLTLGDRWWYGVDLRLFRLGFGPLAGYGYRVKWAFIIMLSTVVACALLYMLGYPALMTKTSDHAGEFQSLMYSLDVFVPIIDFSQAAWTPDANKGAVLIHGIFGDLRTGGLLLAVYWIEVALGWVVSSVVVGTITSRLVRN